MSNGRLPMIDDDSQNKAKDDTEIGFWSGPNGRVKLIVLVLLCNLIISFHFNF